ncbi:MAG TPA: hypothetical protein VNP04_08660 [Alphaproteobacteria bacterium]|nr:hypothetical protein [Alphaproteobacteria bacterium]
MDTERNAGQEPVKRSFREWIHLVFPEARMRVATRRMPRDWFELLTKIPVVERIVIKRFVENLMCDQWLKEPHSDLQGMDPTTASKEAHGRTLLRALLTRMAQRREKTPRELRRIRKQLGM